MKVYDPEALGLQVTKYSGVEAVCLCPYHDDTDPSGSFNMKKGVFYCYSCETGAHAKKLVRVTGGRIQLIEKDIVDRKSGDVLIAHRFMDYQTWFDLTHNTDASRETVDLVLRHRFPENFEKVREICSVFKVTGIKDPLSDKINIMIPTLDKEGIIVGYLSRFYRLRDKNGSFYLETSYPKYVLYGKKESIWPYGGYFSDVHNMDEIYITEGRFGVINLMAHGLNAFSIQGAHLFSGERGLFSRIVDKSVVVFDQDQAGYKATKNLLKKGVAGFIWGVEADSLVSDKRIIQGMVAPPRVFSEMDAMGGMY